MPETPETWEHRLDRIERSIDHLVQLAARHDEQIAGLKDVADRTLKLVQGLTQVSARHEQEIANMNRKVAEASEAAREAAAAGKHTEEKLNALLGYVSGWRQPPPEPPKQ
ncbi:MAG: hypothetical protein FJW20_08895 [Acidimicrobiia bacterium]|nr:hypothetical protein [Acidimicrobiia bacterium]